MCPVQIVTYVSGRSVSAACPIRAQWDRSTWAAQKAKLAARFRSESRDHWRALFAGSDACLSPVLTMPEAPGDDHNRQRATFVARGGRGFVEGLS